jgi:SAM-dependent methyltransferase
MVWNKLGGYARAVAARDRRLFWRAADRWGADLDDRTFVRVAYEVLLERSPDAAGLENYLTHLAQGTRTRRSMLEEMRSSDEFWFGKALRFEDAGFAIHRSRCLFVQQFPAARRIIDLGGTHQQKAEGALIALGYPYDLERLVIVDLPAEERHELYESGVGHEVVQTPRGPVEYSYHSMADLSGHDDGSFDLVYSGQTIEHVPEDVAATVLSEAGRVLVPGGHLCLDTPNGRLCRLQMEGTGLTVTNPDHDVEYDHVDISRMITDAGFEITHALGLLHMPRSAADGRFHWDEFGAHVGVFSAIEECYVLAYVARRRD